MKCKKKKMLAERKKKLKLDSYIMLKDQIIEKIKTKGKKQPELACTTHDFDHEIMIIS
jgi:hypothetical protein